MDKQLRENLLSEFFTDPYYSLDYILDTIKQNIEAKNGYAIMRVGDFDAAVLGQGCVFDWNFLRKNWGHKFNPNTKGICLPDIALRDRLVEAYRNADMLSRFALGKHLHLKNAYWYEFHGKIMVDALKYWRLLPENNFMYTFANREMLRFPEFWSLLKDYKTVLIGDKMEEVKQYLDKFNLNIVYAGDLCDDSDIKPRLKELELIDYDWALVAAASTAKIFISEIKNKGKVGFDLGSANMNIINGFHDNIIREYLEGV